MPYVMVPVPEEQVATVMGYLLRLAALSDVQTWDTDSVNEVYLAVDEVTRSLLAFVARASLESRELSDVEAAKLLELSVREAMGAVSELSALSREGKRPNLVRVRTVSERQPNGRVVDKRVFQMKRDVAEMVNAAEQAEVSSAEPRGG